MKTFLLGLAFSTLLTSYAVFAGGEESSKPTKMTVGRETAQAELAIAVGAEDAVAAVERFSTALSSGDLAAAGAELDPAVLILESGGVERSRDEYLGGHAKSDARFLKAAQVTLKRRHAHASGDLVWVASESDIRAAKDAEMVLIASTETMVLKTSAQGWKIVHIHWSSRRAGGKH